MKKYYFALVLLFSSLFLFAQATFRLSVNQLVERDTLRLLYYIKSLNNSNALALGSSDFVVKINGNDLEVDKAVLVPNLSLGNAYLPLEIGIAEEMIGLYVRLNHQTTVVPTILNQDTLLATVFVPIKNKCEQNSLTVLTDAGSSTQIIATPYSIEYITTKFGIDATPPIPLDGGFSITQPKLLVENGVIKSTINKNNVWYFNGNVINATGDKIEIIAPGEYMVESRNECTSIFSNPLALRVNNLDKSNDNNFDFQISPNPFSEMVKLTFNLVETSHVKLEVFDILGVKKAEIINDFFSSGKQEITWSSAKSNLNAGHYFFRLTANGKSITNKAIYTAQ